MFVESIMMMMNYNKKLSGGTEAARYFMSLYIAKSLKVIGNSTIRQIVYEFLLAFHNMTLSCIISEIKRDIGRKSQFLIPPAFDAPPAPVRWSLF